MSPKIHYVKDLCEQEGVNFEFKQESTIECSIEETDLLFIDTLHMYVQLKKELQMHSEKVRKYILMHDTETFKDFGEDENGIKGSTPGLQQAIDEFLQNNSDWTIHEVYKNNNGLTILQRNG